MKIRYFLLIIITIGILSCKKDGAGGLSVKIKSVSSSVVPVGSDLQVILEFTDNSGQAIDSVYMKKIRINQRTLAPDNIKLDSFLFVAPSYSGSSKGELQLDLDYETILKYAVNPYPIDSTHFESDSLMLKFAIEDNANHKSDTVTTGLIVVERVQ